MADERMKRRTQIVLYCAILIATIVSSVLPYIPGPSIVARPALILFSANQMAAVLSFFLVLPVGLAWTGIQLWQRATRNRDQFKFNVLSVLLVVLPLVAMFSAGVLADAARSRARLYAIDKASAIVNAVAAYREASREYPDDLRTMIPRYLREIPAPGPLGASGFEYRRTHGSFNLSFSQCVVTCFNFEVVTYDPLDQQEGSGKTPTLLDTGRAHWKYYIYD